MAKEDKYLEAKKYMESIEKERTKLEALNVDVSNVRTEIQNRLMTYIKNSKRNMPNLHSSKELIDSLSGLFKTELDISDKIMRSYEKSIELNAKYVPSEEGEDTPVELSFDDLFAIKKRADKELLLDKQKEKEDKENA